MSSPEVNAIGGGPKNGHRDARRSATNAKRRIIAQVAAVACDTRLALAPRDRNDVELRHVADMVVRDGRSTSLRARATRRPRQRHAAFTSM
ncbi:hypothetical protein WT25_10330 [Burkholderia territorii]|nr:hypothetical protein WT25_10330 [Burkholderia territorii]